MSCTTLIFISTSPKKVSRMQRIHIPIAAGETVLVCECILFILLNSNSNDDYLQVLCQCQRRYIYHNPSMRKIQSNRYTSAFKALTHGMKIYISIGHDLSTDTSVQRTKSDSVRLLQYPSGLNSADSLLSPFNSGSSKKIIKFSSNNTIWANTHHPMWLYYFIILHFSNWLLANKA